MNGTETPVVLFSGGQQVVGMWHLPAQPQRVPAIMMLHGFTGNKQETKRLFVQAARSLASAGIATLRFDFRGCGDSAGEFHEMTVSSMCADARTALAWLANRPEIDPTRIGILGMSLGGMIAALLQHEHAAIKTAVLWCPVTNPRDLIARRATPESQVQMNATGIADQGGWAVGHRFVTEMMAAEPVATLCHAAFPILILHGDADQMVPVEHSIAAVETLRRNGRNVTFKTMAGADHAYSGLPWIRELLSETFQWFDAQLRDGKC
jgi:dipeptidyl aminopeptidase/acylaminoacyl peptidase